jgi:serine/threonine protein kinase
MAPEVLQDNKGHTEKADIWSLGITAIELATGSAPYASLKELDVVQKILKAPPPQLPRGTAFSAEYRDFVKRCMNFDPRKRPSAKELLDHPFIAKAAKPSYIVDYVLKDLPPLGDRYEAVKTKFDITKASLDLPLHGSGSCPTPVQWSFIDDWESEKKGRFTIKRAHPQEKATARTPEFAAFNEQPEQMVRAKHVVTFEELEKKVDRLSDENRKMRREIDLLTALVMKLAGQP